jgi:citrate lyase subunit alpha / citrate CoA-transferase
MNFETAELDGYGRIRPFRGAFAELGSSPVVGQRRRGIVPGHSKRLADLDAAIDACGLRDGATLSFHHHLRNGDGVLNAVMAAVARKGLRDIHVAATSIFPVHAPLVDHIRSGTVTQLSAAFVSGPVGEAVSQGLLPKPLVLRTHGGRARALEARELHLDAAFVAAPAADAYGNISGRLGPSACGTLGYPMCDAEVADFVVAVTDNILPYPAPAIDIPQHLVDFVVEVAAIGDPSGIVSGATRPAEDATSLGIADLAAAVIAASGLLRDGFSFQTGAGGISLATAAAVKRRMLEGGIEGSFAAGGITGFHVEMLEAGLFRSLLDVQCFDLVAVESYKRNPAHQAMSASMYANPHNRGPVVNMLDAVILGAAEIDLDFNVNVTTKADGMIMGGSGGHADTAAGAKLAIITTRLVAAGFPKIVDRVGTLTTPGETIDVVVTDAGVAVNPRREELRAKLQAQGLPVVSMEDLRRQAESAGAQPPSRPKGAVVAVSEYRDGTVTDLVRQA